MLGRFFKRYDIDRLDNYDPALLERIVGLLEPILMTYFRAEVRGLERIGPGKGLYVGNHSGATMTPDSFVFGCALFRHHGIDYMPYGLGHEGAISLPFIHQLIVPLGAVRASHENGHRIFAAGKKAMVYPGGDVDNMRPYAKRDRLVFGGRTGYIRLALREAVPCIPVVCAGGHATMRVLEEGRLLSRLIGADKWFRVKVLPLTLSFPWGISPVPPMAYIPWPSRMLIEVLPPITFDRSGPDAADDVRYVRRCADEVEEQMQLALTRLAAERRGVWGAAAKELGA